MKIFKIFILVFFSALFLFAGKFLGEKYIQVQTAQHEIDRDDIVDLEKETAIAEELKEKIEKKQIKVPENAKTTVLIVEPETLGLREYHSFESEQVAELLKDEILKYDDYFNSWFRVITKTGVTGWVHSKYVKRTKLSVPPEMFPARDEVIKLNAEQVKDKLAAIKTHSNLPLAICKMIEASIKYGYGMSYSTIDKMYYSDIFQVYAYYKGWFKIKLPMNSYGWTRRENLYSVKEFDLHDKTVMYSSSSVFANRYNSLTEVQVLQDKQYIKSGPGNEFGDFHQLGKSDTYKCFAKHKNWLMIYDAYSDVAGWINADNVLILDK